MPCNQSCTVLYAHYQTKFRTKGKKNKNKNTQNNNKQKKHTHIKISIDKLTIPKGKHKTPNDALCHIMLKQFPRTKRHQRKQQNILAVRLKAYQNAHLCNQPFYNHFIYHCLIPCSLSCKMKWGFLCTVCTRLWVCNCLLEYFCCCHYVSACLWVCNCLLTHFFLLFFSHYVCAHLCIT